MWYVKDGKDKFVLDDLKGPDVKNKSVIYLLAMHITYSLVSNTRQAGIRDTLNLVIYLSILMIITVYLFSANPKYPSKSYQDMLGINRAKTCSAKVHWVAFFLKKNRDVY